MQKAPYIVAQKQKNEIGIYDMSGNVKELCSFGGSSAENVRVFSIGSSYVHSTDNYRTGDFRYYYYNDGIGEYHPNNNTTSEFQGFRIARNL